MIHLTAVALSAALALAPQAPDGAPANGPTSGRVPAAAVAPAAPGTPAEAGSAAGPRRLQRFGELDGTGKPADPDVQVAASGSPSTFDGPAAGDLESAGPGVYPGMAADTPVARRTKAIEHSQGYYTRLAVHRIGSYAILPLFAGEYFLGQNLLTSLHPASWVRPTHKYVALGVAGVFGVNTITGVWNLWDARHDTNGRARRTVHALSMLVADAGFVWVGTSARQARFTSAAANQHRNIALGSMGLTVLSGLYMQLTK